MLRTKAVREHGSFGSFSTWSAGLNEVNMRGRTSIA